MENNRSGRKKMHDFPSIFNKYRNRRIAVYGLSLETKKILPELDGMFQVMGLLDGYRQDGSLYGKQIISMEQAIKDQVEMILVVARPGSSRAIAKRIGSLCTEKGIRLFDVRGKDLCDQQRVAYSFDHIQGITRKQLFQYTKDSDAVSFDFFDTLMMRQVLFISDVFGLIDRRLKKKGIFIENFCGKRLESEKSLSQETAPSLEEIYTYMVNIYSIQGILPEELARLEWDVDQTLLIPRWEMCRFVAEMIQMGKDVYIVSDTYYTGQQIEQLLDECGVYGYKAVLASCEYGTGKMHHLFGRLKDKLRGKTCIHIGDDISVDIESARKHGLGACQINSGIELLEMSGYLGFWGDLDGLSDRIKMGMFAAKIFNSPFQFESVDRKIYVENAYDIGYLFFAPMITDFVLWFNKQVREEHIQNVWFCARDGYLIKKMYDRLTNDTSSVYFLTSRMAAVRAGVESEEDIVYVEEMNFSGSLPEQLEKRFGIFVSFEKVGNKLSDHIQEILTAAAQNRRDYKKYIDKLKISQGDIAFFDFVSKGTCQMFVSRLVTEHLKGYYFLQLEKRSMKEKLLDIQSFYGQEGLEDSAIYNDYYILEVMLTSPMPTLEGFDRNGEPRYAKETRKASDMRCFQDSQEGILDYFKTYLDICGTLDMQIDKQIDEMFLSLLHKVSILDRDFLDLIVEDPFFERTTSMKDLI